MRSYVMSAVNRDIKTPAALIALARHRRMQRALAHAYVHRHAPLPDLRSSLGYMTTTTRMTDARPEHAHRMQVLGVSRSDGSAYVLEEVGDDTPVVYRFHLHGARRGLLVPLHAWYEHSDDLGGLRARIAALVPTLEPVQPATTEAWMLSTRIVQRRALRVGVPGVCADPPIRKFALQLTIEPVSDTSPRGRSTVTAFLSPHAQLADVWSLGPRSAGRAGDLAIARVSFSGLPSSTGLTKDTVILLTP